MFSFLSHRLSILPVYLPVSPPTSASGVDMSRHLHFVSLCREKQVAKYFMLSKALLLPWSEPEKYDLDASVQVGREAHNGGGGSFSPRFLLSVYALGRMTGFQE